MRKTVKDKRVYSVSGIRSFQSCARKYYFERILCISPRVESIHFVTGRAWGRALVTVQVEEAVEPGIAEVKAVFDASLKNPSLSQRDIEEREKARAATCGMLRGYAEVWLKKDLKNWEFVEFEREFNIKMPGGRIFTGFIDEVITVRKGKRKGTWPVENKTAGQIGPYHTRRLPMDLQLRGYFYASKRLGEDPKGILYFAVRKSALRGTKGESTVHLLQRISDQYTENPKGFFLREWLKPKEHLIQAFEDTFSNVAADIERAQEAEVQIEGFTQNPGECFSWNQECPFFLLCTRGLNKMNLNFYKARTFN